MLSVKLIAPAAALLAAGIASQANATTMITSDGKVIIDTADLANVPFTWTVTTHASAGSELSGLESKITYTLSSITGSNSVFNIAYSLDNTSTGNGSQSTIAAFGFDVTGDPSLLVVAGPFAQGSGGNFNGLGQRDFCFYEGSNCNGGGSAGIAVSDDPAVGAFRVTYASAQSTITLDNFATRWQRTGTQANGSASGIGTATAPVPEPATWAMMIAGFGLVGGAMRRRKLIVLFA